MKFGRTPTAAFLVLGLALTMARPAAAQTVLANGVGSPGNILIDNSTIYWGDALTGSIKSVSKNPGGVVTHYQAMMSMESGLVQDGASLYFPGGDYTNGFDLYKMSKAGGLITKLGDQSVGFGSSLTVGPAGGVLYYSSDGHRHPIPGPDPPPSIGVIAALSTQGGNETVLIWNGWLREAELQSAGLNYWPGVLFHASCTDSVFLYWTDSTRIWRMPLVGGAAGPIVPDRTNIHHIVTPLFGAAAGSIFWTEGTDSGENLMRRKADGQIITVLSDVGSFFFAVDNDRIFCADGDGGLVQVSIDGGTPVVIAPVERAFGPIGIAVDRTYVFWSNFAGQIMRIARPSGGTVVAPFVSQAGTFTAVLDDGTGMVTLTLTNSGTFTAKLIIKGLSYSLTGGLDGNGGFVGTIGSPPLTVDFHLDPAGGSAGVGSFFISGSLGGSTFAAHHTAYAKGQPVTEAGKYTLLLQASEPSPEPVGQLFVTDGGSTSTNGSVNAFTTTGEVVKVPLITGLNNPSAIAASSDGKLFVISQGSNTVGAYTTAGTVIKAPLIAGLGYPTALAVSGSNLFVADANNNTVGKYTLAGAVVNASLITGLTSPYALAVSGSSLFVANLADGTGADNTGSIGHYTTDGAVVNASLITGLPGPAGLATSGSSLFVANFGSGTIGEYTFSGATVNAALVSSLGNPLALAAFGNNLFAPNTAAGTVGKYSASGVETDPSLITGIGSPLGVAILPAGPVPLSSGYAILSVSSVAKATLAGKLADGTPFTASGPLVGGTGNGQFSFYLPKLYSSKGLLAGTIRFETPSDLQGEAVWLKPIQPTAKIYRDSIDTSLQIVGQRYTPPASGRRALALMNVAGNAQITMAGGNLAGPFQKLLTINERNAANALVSGPDRLKLTLNVTNGLMSGTFIHPGTRLSTRFDGVLLQGANIGEGFFLGSTLSGSATLEPNPAFGSGTVGGGDNGDTRPPTLSITSPAANARINSPLGVTMAGTATDAAGISGVYYQVLHNGAISAVYAATGAAAWTIPMDLAPDDGGVFTVFIKTVDNNGNESALVSRSFTYVVLKPLTVSVSGLGSVSSGYLNSSLREIGKSYTLSATPARGSVFAGWSGSIVSGERTITFTMTDGLALQANFVPLP